MRIVTNDGRTLEGSARQIVSDLRSLHSTGCSLEQYVNNALARARSFGLDVPENAQGDDDQLSETYIEAMTRAGVFKQSA